MNLSVSPQALPISSGSQSLPFKFCDRGLRFQDLNQFDPTITDVEILTALKAGTRTGVKPKSSC